MQLTTEAGCILCGVRVLIPAKFCKQVLDELHAGHLGIVRMKSLALLHVWWPGIDTEIETIVHNCSAYQGIRNHQPPTTSHPLDLAKPTLATNSPGLRWSLLGAYVFAGGGCTFEVDRGCNDDFHHNRENHYRVA